jgi:DNA (cytosine-5)-methyltransferase 1
MSKLARQTSLPFATTAAAARPGAGAPLRVVGLFAGIGGIERGLARAGHETLLLCEIEPGAQAVLRAQFPGLRLEGDIRGLHDLPPETECVVGGFPCQDLSQAGRTMGIEGSRSGLVGEVFRLLDGRDIPWVLLENVPFMLALSKGRAMDVIVDAFEARGYRWAYRVVDSRAFGVPQRRERVYFLATRDGDPRDVLFADDASNPAPERVSWRKANGFYWTEGIRGLGWADDAVPTLKGGSTIGIPSAPAIVMPGGRIVTPHICDAERLQGFPARWTEPSESVMKRGHRWKLVGNAVTVDAAEWIGGRLRDPDPVGRSVACAPLVRDGAWPRAAFNVGAGRWRADVSAWPERRDRRPLHEWLEHPTTPLSEKATAGFYARTKQSSLRFPDGFIERVERHLQRMRRGHETHQLATI